MVAMFISRRAGRPLMIAMWSMGVGAKHKAAGRTDDSGDARSGSLPLGSDHLEGGLRGELSDA